MLEKGKGLRLGKLRIIKLIETDLQLLFRIIIGLKNNEVIEKNDNMSKFNYGNWKNYSIEDALLEKRLIHESNT